MLHYYEKPDSQIAVDSAVIDNSGRIIGEVSDIIYDASATTPDYIVVDPGRFRASHFVPAAGCYTTAGGNVVVPFERRWVLKAPKAAKGNVISPRLRAQLGEYYT